MHGEEKELAFRIPDQGVTASGGLNRKSPGDVLRYREMGEVGEGNTGGRGRREKDRKRSTEGRKSKRRREKIGEVRQQRVRTSLSKKFKSKTLKSYQQVVWHKGCPRKQCKLCPSKILELAHSSLLQPNRLLPLQREAQLETVQ
jgi:hypothetical protein